MAGADSVGSVDSSRRALVQPEPFANSHQTTRTMTPLRKRGRHTAWRSRAAIAGDGVDRGGQCCNHVGIKAPTIEPRTATPSGLARRGPPGKGGIAPGPAGYPLAKGPGGAGQRTPPGQQVGQEGPG